MVSLFWKDLDADVATFVLGVADAWSIKDTLSEFDGFKPFFSWLLGYFEDDLT